MYYRYFCKEDKDGTVIPTISIRKNLNDKYVNINKHELNLITRMFDLWNCWWEETGKTLHNK